MGIAGCAVYEYHRCSFSVFMWGTLAIMFAFPHLITCLMGSYRYSVSTYIEASLFVILFCLIYLLVRYLSAPKACESTLLGSFGRGLLGRSGSKFPKYSAISVCILALSLCVLIVYAQVAFGGIGNASWGAFWGNSAGVYDLGFDAGSLQLIAQYCLFGFCGVIAVARITRRYTLLAISILIVVLYSLITRNRILMLPALVPLIIVFIRSNPKLSARKIGAIVGIAFVVLILVYGMRIFRHAGTLESFLSMYSIDTFFRTVFDEMVNGDGELFLRDGFYYFIAGDNRFPEFGQFNTYIRLVFILVPTQFSFGLKPDEFTVSMASAYQNNYFNTTSSMHPTLFGDCFANGGITGIFLACFWAVFVSIIERILNRTLPERRIYYFSTLSCIFVIIGRGSVYNACLYGLVACAICCFVFALVDAFSVKAMADRSPSHSVGRQSK